MEKLSIEEKAKAYDELLNKAKELKEANPSDEGIQKWVEDAFPELIESKDEKARKALIKFFSTTAPGGQTCGVDDRDILAWLEKQGEPNPDYCHHEVDLSNCSDEYRKAYYNGWNNCNIQHSQCQSESNDALKCLINGMKFYYEDNNEATWGTGKFSMKVKDILSWLEKQGEPNPYSGTSFEYNGHTWGMCARDGGVEIGCDRNLKAFLSSEKSFIYPNNSQESTASESVMEAIKEEVVNNGAEEYKPKFQIGDWIVNPGGEALHITGIKDSCYIFNDELHYWMTRYCDQKCHLWTIEDAKDGDILYTYYDPLLVFILKGNSKKYFNIEYYCNYDIIYSCFHCDPGCLHPTPREGQLRPATKENRELLFRKMKDAGWEWDSENKKLIKE